MTFELCGSIDQIHRARAIVLIEDLLPRLSAVARTEHAALRVRPVRMAQRRYVNDIGIRRIDANARNRLRIASPMCFHVLPASVDLYTPSPCMMLPRSSVSPMPMIDDVGIRFRHGDRAHGRALNLAIGDRLPRRSAISGLPQVRRRPRRNNIRWDATCFRRT